MTDHTHRARGITLVTDPAGVMTPQTAVYLARQHNKNPVYAYFAAAFEAHLREKAHAHDRPKIHVQIEPVYTGGMRVTVDFVPSPGASARRAWADYMHVETMVEDLNRHFLAQKGGSVAGNREGALLAHTIPPRRVDYQTGMAEIKQLLFDASQLRESAKMAKPMLDIALHQKIKALQPNGDYTLITRVSPTEEMNDMGEFGMVAQVDVYRLNSNAQQMIKAALTPIAIVATKGENSQKYTLQADDVDRLLQRIQLRLALAERATTLGEGRKARF